MTEPTSAPKANTDISLIPWNRGVCRHEYHCWCRSSSTRSGSVCLSMGTIGHNPITNRQLPAGNHTVRFQYEGLRSVTRFKSLKVGTTTLDGRATRIFGYEGVANDVLQVSVGLMLAPL